MQKIIKLTFLCFLLLSLSVNSTNAAFPKAKQGTTTTVEATTATEATEATVNKAEFKKELSNLKNGTAQGKSGSGKSKIVAALLAFFLGNLGIHRFYMGQKKVGFMQLGGTIVGLGLYIAGIASFVSGSGEAFPILALIGVIILFGVSLWAFIDFIRILTGGLAPEEGFDS